MFVLEIQKHFPLVRNGCKSWIYFEHHNMNVGIMWWCYKMERNEYTGMGRCVYSKKIGEE